MSISEPPSSPAAGEASLEDQVAWYKSHYEQLETELAEFRHSSQELEAELEKDLDAAEKRENSLREKAEGLSYEVDEWKVRITPQPLVPPPSLPAGICPSQDDPWLTAVILAEEIQGVQERYQRRPERPREGDHDLEGHEPDTATQVA